MEQSPGSALDRDLAQARTQREAAGLWRADDLPGQAPGLDFGSNDYLGLARDPGIAAAMAEAALAHGAGGRAARLLAGGSPLHEACERAVAAWLGAEAALLFPSGYQCNLGLIGALAGRGDAVISDRDNHASLIDGARLARAQVFVHAHLDLDDLARQLHRARGARRRLVLTEGIFSMRGDAAPLVAIDELCARHDAWLVVDEAHSVGLLGPAGAGAWAATGIRGERLCARIVTGGKAMGTGGAFVVGSRVLRAHLVNHARSFLFTTAPPPALAGGLLAAVARCRSADAERERVLAHSRRLAARLGLPTPAAAIVPVPVGDAAAAVALARRVREAGFYVPAVRPPTVAPGESRLRAVCHAGHRAEDVERLAALLAGAPQAAPAVIGRSGRPPLVVVGTDTNVGKTVASALLLRAALRRGIDAAYWKPVQTGSDCDTTTVRELSGAPSERLLRNLAHFPLPASPHEAAAAAGASIEVPAITAALQQHLRDAPGRRLLVELAGGLLVPYATSPRLRTQADWLAGIACQVVVVARSGLGTLNHTLLTLEALRTRRIEPRALLLVGEPHASNRRTLAAVAELPFVCEVPLLSPLSPATIDAWLAVNDLTEVWS